MKLFITGGSGFLGYATVGRLIASGHEVLALARTVESAKKLSALGATPIHGDIEDTDSFTHAFIAMDAIVHCAAPVEFWGPWEKFERQIIHATLSLARAASERGVKRFIYISSEAVLQGEGPLIGITENHPYPQRANSFYGEAKKRSEQMLLAFETQMKIIILRPTFIYGPNCPAIETVLHKAKRGQFIWIDHGKSEFEAVHVNNVADAIVCALTRGGQKSIYFVTDDDKRTVRDFFENLFNTHGVAVSKRSIPSSLARDLAGVVEWVWRTVRIRRPPPLSKFELAFVSQPRRYDISKARRELGYSPQ